MSQQCLKRLWRVPIVLLLASGFDGMNPPFASAAPTLYWCPNRSADQQYSASPERGCAPLVEKKKDLSSKSKAGVSSPRIKVENIQPEATAFLKDYRAYLNCCATDPDSLDDLGDLDDRAAAILGAAQDGLFSEKMKLRGFMFSEVIPPVARARDQLRDVRKRLEQLSAAKDKMEQPQESLEAEGRARQRVEALEESIVRQSQQQAPIAGPKTGAEIGRTPPTGTSIGKVPATGPDFGTQGRTGRDLGYTPATGKDIGQNAPTGFEIGKTGVAGPSIGDSDLDKRPSGVSSTLGGSSVGSNLGTNPLGSNLSPTRVDSDLQSRPPTPPQNTPLSTIDSTLRNRATQ